ncbi:response regulator [Burkholderia seminalis]|uniref:ATP-binding protein n=1 Tax=Burkholderia seminalis TaxID=488731 RepID=UPI001CF0E12D|nr:ATP-binding protein [Burkholderia seminalis]MCA8300108.1 response regulator [Burkholderia seminalis]
MVSSKGRAVLIAIMIGWIPAPGMADGAPQFTPEEKAWIASHPVVRTRADSKWHPFEFRENGKVVGVVPSFLEAISRISGLRFQYVDDVTWRNSAEALHAGAIDIVPDVAWRPAPAAVTTRSPEAAPLPAGSRMDAEPRRDIIVSRPYFVGTTFVVTTGRQNLFVGARSLAGRRVAIKGGGSLEAAIRHGDIPVILLTYDDEHDALAAVANGDADVAIGPDVSVLPLVQRQYRDELFVSGGLPDSPYTLSMATRSDMPVLASILDKSLAAISAPEAEHIARRWFEAVEYGEPSLHSILYYRRGQVVATGSSLLALIAIAFVSWRSRVAAVRRERDKAMFLAFISHEIRTPMHTILSSLELLQRAKLPPKQSDRADAALAASESLLALLDDVLEYSRLESHNVTLAPEPTYVGPWIQRSADMMRWRIDEKKLSFVLELACPPGLCVLIDPVRTRQIVLNLLVNASKFTSAGSIALRVDYVEGTPNRTGSLLIEVRDTGIGISPEKQRGIFDPYQRIEQSGNRRVAGSGLGLSICRELVDLMKGVVTVSSSPDKGTIFTVILPARHVAHMPPPGTIESGATTSEQALPAFGQTPGKVDMPQSIPNCRTILVVDDHEAVQHAIQHQLDVLACHATVADTGEHALEQFERMKFDMVLLDCALPDIDGYTVAQRMRDSERRRKRARTPIIAISASTGDAHRERCFDSGMDGVLGKPLRLETLRQMIDLWCPPDAADEAAQPVWDAPRTKIDFRAIYRQSVGADLVALGDALSSGDVERALNASHRIKGAAAVAGHAATSELAAELERRLQFASGGIPPSIEALGDELLRLHRADTATPGTRERESGDEDA